MTSLWWWTRLFPITRVLTNVALNRRDFLKILTDDSQANDCHTFEYKPVCVHSFWTPRKWLIWSVRPIYVNVERAGCDACFKVHEGWAAAQSVWLHRLRRLRRNDDIREQTGEYVQQLWNVFMNEQRKGLTDSCLPKVIVNYQIYRRFASISKFFSVN